MIAVDPKGSSLATCASKTQGAFELRVPLKRRSKTIKKETEDVTKETPVSFHLVVSQKNLEHPQTSSEMLTAVAGRVAYREIVLTIPR